MADFLKFFLRVQLSKAACMLGLCIVLWTVTWTVYAEETASVDIRFMGTDLVDEMVFSWLKKPPFREVSAVTLVELSAPLGLDERFSDLVENRLYELLRSHPELPLSIVYCGICRQFVTYSSQKATVLGRGIDNPQVFDGLLLEGENKKALSLKFEAQGKDLVLFAYIFELKSPQKILWAERYSQSSSSRTLLRQPYPLISMDDAKKEQNMILQGREPYELVTRIVVRQYSLEKKELILPPLIFLEQNIDSILLPDRKRRASFGFGFMSIKNYIEAWTVSTRILNLLIENHPSLYQPDFYWFVGFSYTRMRGDGARPYGDKQVDFDRILDPTNEPKATLTSWMLGLETHVKYRYGFHAFIENTPLLNGNDHFKSESLLGIPYHAFGAGMVWRW